MKNNGILITVQINIPVCETQFSDCIVVLSIETLQHNKNVACTLCRRLAKRVSDNYTTHAVLSVNVKLLREHEHCENVVDTVRGTTVFKCRFR